MRDDKSILLVHAAGACDATGFHHADVSAVVRLSTSPNTSHVELIAIGPRAELAAHPAAIGRDPIDLPHCILIPGLTNAHAHLDLTHLGPRPFDADAGFVAWIGGILKARDELATPVADAVRLGIAKSQAGGVVAIGDISGTPEAAQILRDGPLRGIGFLEVFGLGDRAASNWARTLETLESMHAPGDEDAPLRISVQPHAPYSASRDVYDDASSWAATHAMPIATHWSETPAEFEFVAQRTGPMCNFLKRLGIADARALEEFGHGATPIEHVEECVRGTRVIAAHVNHATDNDIDILAQLGATVAYCPRASAYFHHDTMFGPHRYRDMLARGINVALGTDSIICHPAEQADRLSTLDDARLLHARDGLSPQEALALITINGARALGLDESAFVFPHTGAHATLAGLNVVDANGVQGDPATRVMRATTPAEPLEFRLAQRLDARAAVR
ncbi:MAG: amidohydrolase family protein [Phycisphaerales bacterium]|nr:amidohydrolase family protein [Phycisphaerales bacterium]